MLSGIDRVSGSSSRGLGALVVNSSLGRTGVAEAVCFTGVPGTTSTCVLTPIYIHTKPWDLCPECLSNVPGKPAFKYFRARAVLKIQVCIGLTCTQALNHLEYTDLPPFPSYFRCNSQVSGTDLIVILQLSEENILFYQVIRHFIACNQCALSSTISYLQRLEFNSQSAPYFYIMWHK